MRALASWPALRACAVSFGFLLSEGFDTRDLKEAKALLGRTGLMPRC
jgi:hypothetical protein